MGGVDCQPRASPVGSKTRKRTLAALHAPGGKYPRPESRQRGGMRDGTRGEHTEIQNDDDGDEFAGQPWSEESLEETLAGAS
jgi:hypothetical protein